MVTRFSVVVTLNGSSNCLKKTGVMFNFGDLFSVKRSHLDQLLKKVIGSVVFIILLINFCIRLRLLRKMMVAIPYQSWAILVSIACLLNIAASCQHVLFSVLYSSNSAAVRMLFDQCLSTHIEKFINLCTDT